MRMLFQLPNRVSRLYPIFSLILLFSASIFFYAWQTTVVELNDLPRAQEKNKILEKRINDLTTQQQADKVNIFQQQKKIVEGENNLADLKNQLKIVAADLEAKEQQLKNQQQQLSQNATDLEKLRTRPPLFSFQNNSSLDGIEPMQNEVKEVVTNAYSYIQKLYGTPYLLNSIKITFVDQFQITGSSGEIIIENTSKGIAIDIHLKSFDKNNFQDVNTIIHEIIHGFHGVAVFDSSALEEGMTIAAADAVMEAMIKDGLLTDFGRLYLTVTDSQYLIWNQSLKVLSNNDLFYKSADVAKVYQLIGTAWYRFYAQDKNFFKNFNQAFYTRVQQGHQADNAMVLDTIREVTKSVSGESIDTYLSTNRAFYPQ